MYHITIDCFDLQINSKAFFDNSSNMGMMFVLFWSVLLADNNMMNGNGV